MNRKEREAAVSLVRTQFGTHAAGYVASEVHAKGESLARLVALARPQRDWRVIDVATGAGHMALAFAPHVAHVTASDITAEMLVETARLAEARGLGNVATVLAPADALPFADTHFDLVTCRLAAHHFTDPDRFVAEAWRVLKPCGLFGLVDNIAADGLELPGRSEGDVREAAAAYNAFEKLRDPSHGRALQFDEWISLIQAQGFSIVAAERLRKSIDFESYVRRMNCSADKVARLEAALSDLSAPLAIFLDPKRTDAGALEFDLREAVILARKPAQ